MSAPAQRSTGTGGLAPAFAAVRVRLGLVAALFALAAVGWWWTAQQMWGMDQGPWTGLGSLGWFLGVWVVMMAAMMFPSVAPTVTLYSRLTQRSPLSPLLFTTGYLVTWACAGLGAFALAAVLGRISGDLLAWDRAGRWIAGATLVVAAVYELTPSRTCASANAEARWASCSAPGVTAAGVRCGWAPSTAPGASGAAGR
jgi:hypothetical protein